MPIELRGADLKFVSISWNVFMSRRFLDVNLSPPLTLTLSPPRGEGQGEGEGDFHKYKTASSAVSSYPCI